MAEKRFYWLKLKEDYFNSPKIKKLRKIAGGDTYTIIYLKMQLLSVKNEGVIEFDGIEPTIEEELALKLDEDVENVKITLSYLESQNLYEVNENQYLLLDACNNIGSEGQSAERKRRFDEKRREALLCNGSVTQEKRISISKSNNNINSLEYNKKEEEIKKEEERRKSEEQKHKYGEYKHVLLTDKQYKKLVNDFGKENATNLIKKLDESIEMKGYKYKNHNLVLRGWVLDNLKKSSLWKEVKKDVVIKVDTSEQDKRTADLIDNDPKAKAEFEAFMRSRSFGNILKEF